MLGTSILHGYLVTSVDTVTLESWGIKDDTTVGVILCCDEDGLVYGELLNRQELLDNISELQEREGNSNESLSGIY